MNEKQAYRVTTEGDGEGRTTSTVGYARGDPEDIKKYYEGKRMYGLDVTPIEVVDVTPETLQEANDLKGEKRDLEARLAQIKEELKGRGL